MKIERLLYSDTVNRIGMIGMNRNYNKLSFNKLKWMLVLQVINFISTL